MIFRSMVGVIQTGPAALLLLDLSLDILFSLEILQFPGKPRSKKQLVSLPLKLNIEQCRFSGMNFFGSKTFFNLSGLLIISLCVSSVIVKQQFTSAIIPSFTNARSILKMIVMRFVMRYSKVQCLHIMSLLLNNLRTFSQSH